MKTDAIKHNVIINLPITLWLKKYKEFDIVNVPLSSSRAIIGSKIKTRYKVTTAVTNGAI